MELVRRDLFLFFFLTLTSYQCIAVVNLGMYISVWCMVPLSPVIIDIQSYEHCTNNFHFYFIQFFTFTCTILPKYDCVVLIGTCQVHSILYQSCSDRPLSSSAPQVCLQMKGVAINHQTCARRKSLFRFGCICSLNNFVLRHVEPFHFWS